MKISPIYNSTTRSAFVPSSIVRPRTVSVGDKTYSTSYLVTGVGMDMFSLCGLGNDPTMMTMRIEEFRVTKLLFKVAGSVREVTLSNTESVIKEVNYLGEFSKSFKRTVLGCDMAVMVLLNPQTGFFQTSSKGDNDVVSLLGVQVVLSLAEPNSDSHRELAKRWYASYLNSVSNRLEDKFKNGFELNVPVSDETKPPQ